MTVDAFPSEPAGPLPEPPETFVDGEGRSIRVAAVGDGPLDAAGERAAIVRMYVDFDQADRAQGLPPAREDAVREWVDRIVAADAVNVVAWHDDAVAGHATLVPDDENGYELAIFVHQDYQHAGIGSRLLRCLLGEGRRRGVDRVWLSVERWNRVAISLYESVGFETTHAESFELEMGLRLS